MVRAVFLLSAVAALLLLLGCAGQQGAAKVYVCADGRQVEDAALCSAPQNRGVSENVTAPAGGAGAGAAGTAFHEWKAPDGSITLQVPEGWDASERQVDKCTVSWSVRNPAGTGSAFMNNQIMVLKSESARQMYKAYGMAGMESAPVNGYLGAEQALAQVIAPLAGSTNVVVTSRNAQASATFSQAACIAGLAACDAQVFEAASDYKGTLMRGAYLVQTYDFGEGTTWWINLWGYESPAADWGKNDATLEKIFASARYTDAWAEKCGSSAGASDVIGEVVKDRQAASEKAAEEWGAYIRGG